MGARKKILNRKRHKLANRTKLELIEDSLACPNCKEDSWKFKSSDMSQTCKCGFIRYI